ncbi:MAG: nucleotidyltransferase domain-containing protein [Nanoarchaeota archaeon]
MEIQIKKTVKSGNSSAVILPRAWLNQEVRVELIKKTPEMILQDVLKITKECLKSRDIIGIYLVGSYARGEEDKDSDIDILVITRDIDREMISKNNYNILLVSSKLLNQKLKHDLLPLGQMIREAKPILNSVYLDLIELKITKENIKWYLDTTESKLKIIKEVISKIDSNKNNKSISDKVAYTLVLRIRTLHIIKKMIEKKSYSKKEFVNIINNISKGKNAYERYLAVKNNQQEKKVLSIEEAEKLYIYLKNQLEEVIFLTRFRKDSR